MTAFYDGKYDVLLSTTIVESGLDIPTANTLIVHRADMFGLAQLYQLRGRVGRSKMRAYALFTLPAERKITAQAERRLKVLQSLDTLGAGFQLASPRPRHPRRRQSPRRGAVRPHQGGRLRALPADAGGGGACASRPASADAGRRPLVAADHHRHAGADPGGLRRRPARCGSALYRRLAELEDEREIEAFAAELIDRFGPLPEEVEHLLEIVAIKALCRRANVEKIDAGPKGAVLVVPRQHLRQPGRPRRATSREQGPSARVRPDMKVVFFDDWERPEARLKGTARILRSLVNLAEPAKAA